MRRRDHLRLSKAIDAWVDRELDDTTARRVARHARDCRDCRSAAELARLIRRSLQRRRERDPRQLAATRLERFARRLLQS